MYSIVLMVAMTHGAATPTAAFENGADFNQVRYGNHLRQEDYRFGRRGRRGRRGGGCCGGGYGGGWGCCGASYGGGWGCCGGGYGGGWGCCGGGYGGGWGCCGSSYAPVSYGCTGGAYEGSMGGWGGSMGNWGAPAPGGMAPPPQGGPGRVPMPGPAGPGGNPYRYNYGSGYNEPGPGAPPAGGLNEPGFGAPPPAAGNSTPEPINPPAGPQTRAEAPATFTVHLPANARLFVDNRPTQSTSATRTFITPPLPENRSFRYTLKAQLPGSSKPLTQTITVHGGQNTDIALSFPEQRLTRK